MFDAEKELLPLEHWLQWNRGGENVYKSGIVYESSRQALCLGMKTFILKFTISNYQWTLSSAHDSAEHQILGLVSA